jgi:hypothetical protein
MRATPITILAASIGAAALFIGACTPKTKLGASWRDPDYTKGRIKKIFVLGIAVDEERRKVFENQFVTTFRNAGVAAEASHTLIPGETQPTKELIVATLEGKGFDAVIVTRLIDVDLNYNRSPGGYYALPADYYNSLYGYYGQAYQVIQAPDYVEYKAVYSLETNLYEYASEKLIWTVQSQAVRKESAYDSIRTFTSKVFERLKKDGFV